MYRVLIVDDERIIREGLAKYIQWENLGIEQVGMAASADEALAYMKAHPVDILVTDIKMPSKSGFDLIDQSMLIGYLPQVILISSYNEFAYAQQACMLDLVCDYILKPINTATFENAVTRAVQRLRRRETEGKALDTREYVRLLKILDSIHFDRQRFARMLVNPDKDLAVSCWKEIEAALSNSNVSLDALMHFASNLLLYIESLFQSHTLGVCPHIQTMSEVYERIFSVSSRKELFQLMEQQVTAIGRDSHTDSLSCRSYLVVTALSRLKKGYANPDLNLSSLALELNVTPNYLSTKFKEETGISFTKYLTAWRVDRAKELLADPGLRVATVSSMVGFSDEKYFIRVFKAVHGETPKKYQHNLFKK